MVLLADLLSTASLDLRLVGGDPDVPVRWVATSELEDPTPFLEGGELLLTTGLRVPREGWGAWVDRLAGAGAAGVGFGVGLSHRAVPRTLVTAARTAGLAVVEVPVPTPFIAVSRRLADLLRRSENEAEAAAARAGRDLAAAAAGPDGARAVLQRTARAVRGSAWLLDAAGTVLAATTSQAPPAAALEGLRRVRDQGARAAWREVTATGTLTLRAGGASRWLLVAAGPDLPRAAQQTVGTAAALLDLLTARPALDPAVLTPVLTAGVVDLVLSGRSDLAARLAAALDLRLPDPVVVVRWSGPQAPDLLSGEHHALGSPEAVADALRGWTGRAGTARPAPLARADPRGADAAWARTTAQRPVVHADGSTLPDLLGPAGLQAWAAGRLEGLQDPQLRRTVEVFLAHHGARQPAADALGVHRNTLRQRLARAEQRLGLSLEDPTDRAEVWLALTATRSSSA
ncbi:PucR family transcriptional regulator ligand-binding domain-containing protein [Kineococcus halophytocola]|uniref:PucR family transcriptional regulator ligand-binding domain-containing protein n=1 Tax=Kineococcus halophytocola TaxID=3234027 RepID=UPI00351AA0B1